jgi:hypothetical protein
MMSSAAYPVEIIPDKPNTIPGSTEKLLGFAPESCSPSARIRVRKSPGTLFGIIPEPCSPYPGFRIFVDHNALG